MKRILITGITGFLGWNLWQSLKDEYDVYGTYCHIEDLADEPNMFKLDLLDDDDVENTIDKISPDILINTAAHSSIAACEDDYDFTELLNVHSVANLASLCLKNDISLVQCSTDMVFDGKVGNYTEQSTAKPINNYGAQKNAAEKIIALLNPRSLIVRLPLMIGESPYSSSGIVADLKAQAKERGYTEAFKDEYRSAALVADVCQGIRICLEKKLNGLVHVAGANKLSRLQIAEYVRAAYNIENLEIKPTTHASKGINNRPKDVTLNINKLRSYGYCPTSLL
jgi:dTDP-4-dehydrorhamnose reductase